MFWTKKALSLGTMATVLLAGGVLLNGRTAVAAQQAAKSAASAKAPAQAPLTEKELIKLIKHNKKAPKKVADEVQARGLNFAFTPQVEKKLAKAGAIPQLIAYMKHFTPSARKAREANKGGIHVSPAEAKAYTKLRSETANPDAVIKDAQSFAQQFPKSPVLTYVYSLEGSAYREKNDAANAVKYGEKSLQLNPKNLISLLLVSEVLPQPQMLDNVSDAVKEKRLSKAATYAHQALQEIDQIKKKDAKNTNPAFQRQIGEVTSGAYSSLGMVHLERSKMALVGPDMGELAKAEQNYKLAIQKAPSPDPEDYYRLGEVYTSEKKLSDAINAFTKAGQLGQGTIIAKLADQQIQQLKKSEKTQTSKTAAKP